jgi:3D (Asp-Asp-Asp) domain-containing protein
VPSGTAIGFASGPQPFCLIIRKVSFTNGTFMTNALRYILLGQVLLLAGCAVNADRGKTTGGPGNDGAHEQKVVKTTAYTDSESGHRCYGVKNAVGSRLQSGIINSAAADWSHFPVGTKFRIVDNNNNTTYVVDDYGPALVGTDTIDLYVRSRQMMNQWGARRVKIEVLEEGSYEKSLEVLKPRQRYWYAKQMVKNIERQIENTY